MQQVHDRPSAPRSSRPASALAGAAVGLGVGVACAAALGPLDDEPPPPLVSIAVCAAGFALTGAIVGAVRHRPVAVGLATGPPILAALAVLVGPRDGWLVLWVLVFGGLGLLGAVVVGGVYRLVRGAMIAEPGAAADRAGGG